MIVDIVQKAFVHYMYALCLKWTTNKDLLHSIGNFAQYYMAAWMGGESGREWIHVYVWLSFFSVHKKLSHIDNWLCCCCVASVVSDSARPHRQQPTRLPHPWEPPGKTTGVGCHFLLQCMKVKSESEVAQSCPTPRRHGLQPTRLLRPWDFPDKSAGVGCHCLLLNWLYSHINLKV